MSANKYTFTIEGTEYTIPAFKSIPVGVIARTRNITDEADKVFTMLETLLKNDSDTLDALYTLSGDEFGERMQGWLGEATLGEASGSES